jgi:hypothetical protein
MRKLNCLIAVLEVATAKVRKSMVGSPPDSERLARICANLESTLEVCQRARTALQRREATGAGNQEKSLTVRTAPPGIPAGPIDPNKVDGGRRGARRSDAKRAEPRRERRKETPDERKQRRARWAKGVRPPTSDITSDAERRKFAKLPPIDRRAIASCNFEDLLRRLTS